MDAPAAARAWVDAWTRGWPARDVDAIAVRYADGAPYFSHPFREPTTARAYLEFVFGPQADVEFRFGEPVVDGNRAAVEYWCVITDVDGSVESIAGSSFLRFDEDGLVVEHRDYWTGAEGRDAAPPGFGNVS
ncbi:MAG: hypothetical protein QOE36_33 [Gaiellaceae bacterium]|nr:hypothetical protein [Gaiellaceae bacterium]